MMLWSFFIGNLSKIGMSILGIITLFLYGKNSKLFKDNTCLQQNLKTTNKIIDIQNKVIDVVQNTKPTDLDGNIERMRNGEL